MKTYLFPVLLFISMCLPAQEKPDSGFKKRVLDKTEISVLTSIYGQNGNHAAVTGGIGNENLQDYATNIVVSVPLNDDDILTVDATVSAYSSASSSNLNPITGASRGNETGASQGGGDDDGEGDDDDRPAARQTANPQIGSPWVASNNVSRHDVWINGILNYSHSSDDRNQIYSGGISVSNEFDYFSLGGNFSYVKLFNEQNTSLHFGAKIYVDQWFPTYPYEIKAFVNNYNGNLDYAYFSGVNIYDQNGQVISKYNSANWRPLHTDLIRHKGRNTYTLTFSFSQILTQKMQVAFISEMTLQKGWLANPLQRVYFADRPNFYIGDPAGIPHYTDKTNTGTFQLADDIERLPHSRIKIPLGIRWHYYVNENLVIKTYYRYYFDDWGLRSHTFEVELPVKLGMNWTFYPDYRYYTQTGIKYFAPYETHLSTEKFYTSDYDLSPFSAHQIGLGIKFGDALTRHHLLGLGIKSLNLNYYRYFRSNGFRAGIISLGMKLTFP